MYVIDVVFWSHLFTITAKKLNHCFFFLHSINKHNIHREINNIQFLLRFGQLTLPTLLALNHHIATTSYGVNVIICFRGLIPQSLNLTALLPPTL